MATIPLPNARNFGIYSCILLETREDGGEACTKTEAEESVRKEEARTIGLLKAKEEKEARVKLRHSEIANLNLLVLAAIVVSSATWPAIAIKDKKHNKAQHQSRLSNSSPTLIPLNSPFTNLP
jgi:hypothetical protein